MDSLKYKSLQSVGVNSMNRGGFNRDPKILDNGDPLTGSPTTLKVASYANEYCVSSRLPRPQNPNP